MKNDLYKQYCEDQSDWIEKALHNFDKEQSHKKQANEYARNNPDKRGFVTFPMQKTGGWHFYFISGGKSKKTGADSCWLMAKGLWKWPYER